MTEHLPDEPRERITRRLKEAYEPIVSEPVPPSLAAMAERLDPEGSKPPEGLFARLRQLVAEVLRRKRSVRAEPT